MSWSLNLVGRPAALLSALDAESARLTGKSKEEYDAALPGLKAVVAANYDTQEGHDQPLLDLTANGHAYGTPEKGYGCCTVKLGVLAGRFVAALLIGLVLAAGLSQAAAPAPAADNGATIIDDLAHANPVAAAPTRHILLAGPNATCGPEGCVRYPTAGVQAAAQNVGPWYGCSTDSPRGPSACAGTACDPAAPVYRGGARFRPLRRVWGGWRGCCR